MPNPSAETSSTSPAHQALEKKIAIQEKQLQERREAQTKIQQQIKSAQDQKTKAVTDAIQAAQESKIKQAENQAQINQNELKAKTDFEQQQATVAEQKISAASKLQKMQEGDLFILIYIKLIKTCFHLF